jgi:hypothetical protein
MELESAVAAMVGQAPSADSSIKPSKALEYIMVKMRGEFRG